MLADLGLIAIRYVEDHVWLHAVVMAAYQFAQDFL